MSAYYSGTSNLVLPVPNKSFFPEEFREKTRLSYYASLFNSIEINASFYQMPLARTVQKWSGEVPGHFLFSFKMHQAVTHALPGQFDLQPVAAFMEAVNATDKRGCILVQLPPKFGPDLLQLSRLLNALTPYNWHIAVEFRHKGWYNENVYELLRSFGATMVLHDMPGSVAPLTSTALSHLFIRFHGPQPGYRGSYGEDHLEEYAGFIKDWLADGMGVFAYFNNTLGAAVQNLQTLNRLVTV